MSGAIPSRPLCPHDVDGNYFTFTSSLEGLRNLKWRGKDSDLRMITESWVQEVNIKRVFRITPVLGVKISESLQWLASDLDDLEIGNRGSSSTGAVMVSSQLQIGSWARQSSHPWSTGLWGEGDAILENTLRMSVCLDAFADELSTATTRKRCRGLHVSGGEVLGVCVCVCVCVRARSVGVTVGILLTLFIYIILINTCWTQLFWF